MAGSTIETARLLLVPTTCELSRVERDPERLAAALGARLADDWPHPSMHAALGAWTDELERRPDLAGWLSWHWLLRQAGGCELIGHGGFKGEPNDSGAIELGYAVVSSRQRRGFAFEATSALVAWAASDARVRTIDAEAASDAARSIGLLEKLGFRRLPATDPAVVRFARDVTSCTRAPGTSPFRGRSG